MLQETGVAQPLSSRSVARVPARNQVAHALVIAALCAAPALVCLHMAVITDPDVWWHLRAGEWIAQHHAVPHTDPFSSFSGGKPWAAYSWLYDLLVFRLFQHAGLVGIMIYSTMLVAAITAALLHMVQRLQSDFTIAVLVICGAWWAMMPLYTPRPWLITVLLFVVELDILLHARRTGSIRELLCLPLLFALWANIHIQFIDGLLVLGIALLETVLARWWTGLRTRLRLSWILPVFFACILAPFLNPYGWKIYSIAHDLAAQPGVLDKITELQAITFRLSANYLLLGLAFGAAFSLGWIRRFAFFETVLLAFAIIASFRSQRDVWILAVSASAILAANIVTSLKDPQPSPVFTFPLAAAVAVLLVALGFRVMHVDNALLEKVLAKDLPLAAVKEVQAKGYAGPLYNNYDWGGFFIWYLRMPVSIDGRAALHGTERMDHVAATWNGEPDWIKDQDLRSAGLVIAPIKAPLTQLLRMDSGFHLVYQDGISAVFISQKQFEQR